MGDVHERDADLGLDALELDLHLPAQLEVESAERLVEQQHLRAVDQRPGQGHALLLAAGELAGAALAEAAELDQLEHLVDLLLDVLDAAAAQPEGDVLEDVEVREQRVVLEHRVDRALVGLEPADVLPGDGDRSRWSAPRDPATIRSVVVLPQPDGPSSAKNAPCSTTRSRSSTATKLPNFLVTEVSVRSAPASLRAVCGVLAGVPARLVRRHVGHRVRLRSPQRTASGSPARSSGPGP